MKFELKLDDILELFPEAKTEGNYNGVHLFGISSLDQAQEGDLSFLGNSKYRSQVFDTKASCLLILMISMVNPKKINYFFESMILPTGLL